MTCHVQKIKSDYYVPENDELFNFKVDQTVLAKEEFLKFVSNYGKTKVKSEPGDSSLSEWYPYVNSYYPYTEDVDAFARVSHLLERKPSFASLSSAECEGEKDTAQRDIPYSENAAQQQYLESTPLSFIILGKPDIGEQELGKLLAEYWQCIYIDPQVLIEREIASGTRAGQCIEFNLKCGRAIGIDVILRLLEKKVKSEPVKHRGFVICGLPLIPNDLYQEDPISSESAVFTVKEIFEEMLDVSMDTAVIPSKPPVSVSSKYKSNDEDVDEEVTDEEKEAVGEEEEMEVAESVKKPPVKITSAEIFADTDVDYNICQGPEIGTNYEDQLNLIFDLMKTPFMIIYVMCNSPDVIEKRKNNRFDVDTKQTINLQTELYNKLLIGYHAGDNEEVPEDFLEPSYMNVDSTQLNYLVKLPRHFPANVSTQLDHYHFTVLNFIERRVLMHDPQYFLKVDGRVSVQRMFHIVKSRLKILPVQKVILPSRLNTDPLEIGEVTPNELGSRSPDLESLYLEFSKREVPSNIFKWNWSDWGTRCPVALKEGTLRTGDANYAVHFMNKIFFLANEENFFKFYRNPRPYLLPPYPKSPCKIFVYGPKNSGKSAISYCLAYLLNGTVVSIADMLVHYLMNQEEELKEKIRQAAIAEAMKILNEQRIEEAKLLEAERAENIKEWLISTKNLIEDLIHVLDEKSKDQNVTSFEISSFPMAMRKVSIAETETPLELEFVRLKEQLQKLRIPFSFNIEDYQTLLSDKRKLLPYIPVALRTKIVPKPATVFDDFVIEYARQAVENADLRDAVISNKSLANIIINHIKTIDEERIQQGEHKGGWILDGMFCDLSILDELYPEFIADEVVVLLDEEDSNFLVSRFAAGESTHFEKYRDFFMSMGKLDAAFRSPSKLCKPVNIKTEVRRILSDIINDPNVFNYEDEPIAKAETYRQEVSAFNEKWSEINTYFLDRNIVPIELKVTDRSIADLMKSAINEVEDRYRVQASLFTELDRAEEVKNFGNQMLQKNISEGGDYASDEAFEKNRRYGDTYHYCPVTFHEKWVLWKGKEDYAVKFENKLYLLSSEDDMNKFLQAPRSYLTGKPPDDFPPPRICVVGVPGVGKTIIAKAIAANYGLPYVSFETLLKKHLDITSSETLDELRRDEEVNANLNAYLNVDVPLPEDVIEDNLSKLWFEQPTLGFVLDDFPKRPSDVKLMTKHKIIPDIVIHITTQSSKMKNKLVKDHLSRWEVEMSKKRLIIEEENRMLRLDWENKRSKRFEELMEEKREQRYSLKRKNKDESVKGPSSTGPYLEAIKEDDEKTDKSGFRTDSQVSFDSVAEQEDMIEVNQKLDIELPEPIFEDVLESVDEATEKFESLAMDTINVETGFLKNIKGLCSSDEIYFTDVTVDFENPEIAKRNAFILTDPFKFRKRSLFERCYEVSMEVAQRLLTCGYFFLSKFGKTCPVQYYEDKNPVQMYMPMEQKYNLFPVIHRSYIYYVGGKENLIKFKEDPLKYILVESFNFPLISFKVGVVGPPKCGKTVLAKRIASEFGFKLISRGQAARYVLTYLPLSDLAKNMEYVLRKGWELTDEMIVKCVEAASFDGKAVTQARRVPVPDERFDYLCKYFKPVSEVPAFLNVVDIAGLVKGASEGQGLGNAFLSHISACDAIFHLCRAFEDDDVTHVEGEVNPVRDLDIISEELRLKDEDTLSKNLEKLERTVLRGGDKKQKPEYDTLQKVKQVLVDEKKHIRFGDWDGKDIEVLNRYLFLTSKPAIYLVNLSEKDYIKKKNKWLIKIKEWVDKNDPGAVIIPFSGAFENKLLEEYSDPELRKKFLEDNNTTSALDKIIVQGYKALKLEYFFTAGHDEVKAWTIQKGTKAPQAAGRIHTDMEKGFIMAEVMKFEDFKEEGSEPACKAAGKYRQQGRNYVVEDGDIIFFKFNAGAGLQAKKK